MDRYGARSMAGLAYAPLRRVASAALRRHLFFEGDFEGVTGVRLVEGARWWLRSLGGGLGVG